MAFTRFHDDPARITLRLQQSTDQGRWILDVPGNGTKPCFALDPQIIPQKWGGNLWTHSTDIQSSLLGIDKRLNRDNIVCHEKYKRQTVYATPIDYPVCDTFLTTEQSRAIMPAWTAKDLPQNRPDYLPIDPQAHTELPFDNYASTRILEKDYYNTNKRYAVMPPSDNRYTLPVETMVPQKSGRGQVKCIKSDSCLRL